MRAKQFICTLNDLVSTYTLCTIYSAISYVLHLFAHFGASSNNFNGNDQNRILGK